MRKIIFCIGIMYCLLSTSCCTNNESRGTDRIILEHQRRVTELEARNNELQRRLDAYGIAVERSVRELEAIGKRAGEMGERIDRIIYLYNEYKRQVEQLIRAYNDTGSPKDTAD